MQISDNDSINGRKNLIYDPETGNSISLINSNLPTSQNQSGEDEGEGEESDEVAFDPKKIIETLYYVKYPKDFEPEVAVSLKSYNKNELKKHENIMVDQGTLKVFKQNHFTTKKNLATFCCD